MGSQTLLDGFAIQTRAEKKEIVFIGAVYVLEVTWLGTD